jgi:pimeloyl-ACP methyl ester carboxylesterase
VDLLRSLRACVEFDCGFTFHDEDGRSAKRPAQVVCAPSAYTVGAMLSAVLAALVAASSVVSDFTVRVSGADVAVRCLGSREPGAPLVVLEAGGGNGLDVWDRVQSPIAEYTRVCAYDRPTLIRGGVGPRTGSSPDEVVGTLRGVLLGLGEKPPYVMVGHSYGGMIVRLYATRYAAEITGLVLIDSSHEDQLTRFEAVDPQTARELRSPPRDEAADLEAFSGALNANRWRSPIPLVVLTHGKTPFAPPGREAQTQGLEKVWLDLQRELATRSPASTHIIATNSGHYIHRDEPTLVIDAVRRVLTGSRP